MKNKRESAPIGVPGMPAIGAQDNAHSFEAFLRGQFRGLVQFLRARTASEQDAEDAAQESMAKLLRYRESEPPSAWKQLLYRIAVNVAHDQYRVSLSHHNKDHVALDGLEIATGEHTPEQRALYDQQVARLSRAILELPPKCQRVYLLKRVHGMSHADIASRCGISVKMVEKHLATALAQLRRKVGDSSTEPF
jgi:RNA polymerase sigma-70 factor (ECF subfamily)